MASTDLGDRTRSSTSELGFRLLLGFLTVALMWLTVKAHQSWLDEFNESGEASYGPLLIWIALGILVGVAFGFALRAPLRDMRFDPLRALALGLFPLAVTIYFVLLAGDIAFDPSSFSGAGPQFLSQALVGIAIMGGFTRG